jgi:LysM repeat protein
MLKAALSGMALTFFATVASFGQASGYQSVPVELANLREDVRLLTQKMGELQLRLEQLERENNELRAKTSGAAQNYASIQQLNDIAADLNRAIKASAASAAATKSETLQQVSAQIEKLAKQMNAAIDSINKSNAATRTPASPASPVSPPQFSDDYPKEGTTYTVQKGDTLVVIAKKTGAKAKDILNANKLTDPSKIFAGQTLFIPGGK